MNADPKPATVRAPLCELRGVQHVFALPGGQPHVVLQKIDLKIFPDEIVALLGPSGCGKSTLLRILAGLVRPTSGEVLYHGAPLTGRNPGVAIVFQSFALYPWLTVRSNIELVLESAGLPRAEIAARADAVVKAVGLGGFGDAYPRELSGGMKQRAGMARALSVDPELLFMDEPFSHVDALTADGLRAEVVDIWAATDKNPSAIVLVSHDIKEVAWMADRIVILGANPGVVRTIVENPLPRPRDYRSRELGDLIDQLHNVITGHELPDVPAPPPTAAGGACIEPIPDAAPSEVVGLLEYLDARGGKDDVFRIAADTVREFGHVIAIVQAAEMLDLVDTPRRNVVLEPAGREFLAASPEQRKTLWGKRIATLGLFSEVRALVSGSEGRSADRERVLELIVMRMPQEDYERMFDRLVRWARYGDFLSFDDATGIVSLPQPE